MIAWEHGLIRALDHAPRRHRVVKYGGSLLARAGWPDALQTLIGRPAVPTTVVVGGGGLVDGLRAIDAAHPLPATLTHRLAIDAMGLTARLVADATGFPLGAEPAAGISVVVLDAPAWLAVGARLADLPVGWHVTSDSIAAAVATACDATLVLAKSGPPPAGDLEFLARAGWVDGQFPQAAAAVGRIEWAAPAAAMPRA